MYLLPTSIVEKKWNSSEQEWHMLRGGNWTYYIGGSNYNFNNNNDIEITTFSYCPSEYSVSDPGH